MTPTTLESRAVESDDTGWPRGREHIQCITLAQFSRPTLYEALHTASIEFTRAQTGYNVFT